MVSRLKGQEIEMVSELVGVFPKINFTHAELLGQAVLDAYLSKGARSAPIATAQDAQARRCQLARHPQAARDTGAPGEKP